MLECVDVCVIMKASRHGREAMEVVGLMSWEGCCIGGKLQYG
ncbi:MAG: hypothetical protein NQU45_07955 [Methanothermobacter sp.]|nr:hypothetical protein [Methanothermobacter sp.]